MDSLVLVASSVEPVRSRLRRGVAERFAVREVTHRAALVRSMANLKPDVLLLDLSLARLGGLKSIPAIQRLNPRTRVIVLTRKLDEREGMFALKAGARGYCRSNIAPALLKRAVERIQDGEIWAGRKLVSSFLDELASIMARRQPGMRAESARRWDQLSLRQRETARLVGGGASNREIATRLKITEKAVKAHLTAIFRKLGLARRLQVALFVAENARAFRS